ncbi:ATP-binding protein [Sphingomonas sp. 36D10-4-7]|uniref:ATP-binding protein n=2 Tax=Sphingomonas corticis TaxID=2722791 RepID=A0ABX1CRY6_9SPHN|nr:ATP-binding protein [Sphingomonas corticis]
MIPATIATAVAPETIARVTRLFNNTAFDVVTELFQNARRAGALAVAVVIQTGGSDTLLHIADDGHGIADPASVVTLGRSGWSEETRRAEDPAGMGVFSLAGRDVIIRSYSRPDRQGWMAHIPASAWETSRPIAISSDPIASGTAITVRVPEAWLKSLEADIARAAKYYPLPVTLNGDMLPREDWLKDADHVEEWNGTRIGVFHKHPSHYSSRDGRLNFHGLTMPCDLPHVQEVDRGGHWIARVDIFDAPAIQLVLPARKEVVENDGIAGLRDAVKIAIYRAIEARGTHRLSAHDWREAAALGIPLPEAEPYLFAWTPPTADYHSSYETGERTADPAMVLMPDFEALVAQPAQAAIRAHNPFGGPLVEAQDAFRGYGWYDVLARVEDLRFRVIQGARSFIVSDAREAPAEAENGWVDAITLEATMSHAGASIEVACDADVAFAPDPWSCNSVEETSIFVRRDSGQTALGVADVFERAVFSSSDDSAADSYDTQQERFQADAAERIIGLLEGDDAALENRIRDKLSGYYFLVPEDRTVTVIVNRDRVEVTIAQRDPAAPTATDEQGAG